MSALKLNSVYSKEEVQDITTNIEEVNFIDSVHPQIVKMLENAKNNGKFQSDKAYSSQDKINFKVSFKLKDQDSVLINKKAS